MEYKDKHFYWVKVYGVDYFQPAECEISPRYDEPCFYPTSSEAYELLSELEDIGPEIIYVEKS